MVTSTTTTPGRRLAGRVRVEWILAVLVLVTVGTLVHPYRAQQASRYALTAAVVERGTVVLDDYEDVVGIDRAIRDGHVYSDKAPGQPLLAVPFYAIGKVAGVEDAMTLRVNENLGLWWVTFWSASVPAAALVVMMYRRIRERSAELALPVTVAIFTGTLLLPFSALLFGHVLAATLLFGSYMLLESASKPGRLVAAGALAGLAVTVEYTTVLGVAVLGLYALWRHRRATLAFVLGGLGPAIGLGIYNYLAFGDPFTLSYQFTAFSQVTDTARPVLDMFRPVSQDNLSILLFGGRGLVPATPVVAVAVAGAVWKLKRGGDVDGAMGLAMFLVFILLPLFWGYPWGGDSPGARYMTPALPFLAVPLLWAWQRWRLLTLFTVGVSAVTMMVATVTDPLISRDATGGVGIWVSKLVNGEVAPTLWTIALGRVGWFVHGLVLLALLLVYRRESPDIAMSSEFSPHPRRDLLQ